MSDSQNNGRTLLIVEGYHEKEKLFYLLLKCFPELTIKYDDILIYKTNIYILYDDIKKEYGENWEQEDIDLAFLVTKDTLKLRKTNFTDIFLVFDYERQDPNFSANKIMKMQQYFSDSTENGKLYINYPMVESYLEILLINMETEYEHLKFYIDFKHGSEYKMKFNKIQKNHLFDFESHLNNIFKKDFNLIDNSNRTKCCKQILSCNLNKEEKLNDLLSSFLEEKYINQAKHYVWQHFKKLNLLHESYHSYLRKMFINIIYYNVCKANKIQNDLYNIDKSNLIDTYFSLDIAEILNKQNSESEQIWILNTSVFIVIDYNSKLFFE